MTVRVDADGNNFYVKLSTKDMGHEGVAVDIGHGKVKTADYGMQGYTGGKLQGISSFFGSHPAYVNDKDRPKEKTIGKNSGLEVVEFKTSKKMDAHIKSLIDNTHTSEKTELNEGYVAKQGYNGGLNNCGDYTEGLLNIITGGEFGSPLLNGEFKTEADLTPRMSFDKIKANKQQIQDAINKYQKDNNLE